MYKTSLRKVGGSVMLAVPPACLDQLKLQVGSTVDVAVEDDRLVIQAQAKPRYTLAQLLQNSDFSAPSPKDRAWLDAPAVGAELL